MHVKVLGNPCAGCVPEVQTEVHSARTVDLTQTPLHALHRLHHLLCNRSRQCGQRVSMLIRHNHDVSGSVRKCIEAHEAQRPSLYKVNSFLSLFPVHSSPDRKVQGGDHIAKNTM